MGQGMWLQRQDAEQIKTPSSLQVPTTALLHYWAYVSLLKNLFGQLCESMNGAHTNKRLTQVWASWNQSIKKGI